MPQTSRARYLDEAKGLGILCIVFLHYENGVIPWTVNTFIGSFMITIFYIIAGWIMAMKGKKIPTYNLAKKRLRSLGYPYIYWTGIILSFDIILWAFGYYDSYFIARETYKSIVLRGIGTLWFLPALFFGEIIWNWLSKRHWSVWLLALIVIMIYEHEYNNFFASRTTPLWNIIKAPFYTISSTLCATITVGLGYIAYKIIHKLNLLDYKFLSFITGIAICISAYLMANYLSLLLGNFNQYLWQLCAPIFGPIGFILIFYSSQNNKLWNYFDYWGRNSLSLMVTHYSIVQVLITIFIVNLLHLPFLGWITILAFIASMPIQWSITLWMNKNMPKLLHP